MTPGSEDVGLIDGYRIVCVSSEGLSELSSCSHSQVSQNSIGGYKGLKKIDSEICMFILH